MNEFIKLRESISDHKNTYDFTHVLLNKLITEQSEPTEKELLFLSRMNNIIAINKDNKVDEVTLIELLSYIGDDPYIDRSTVNTIISLYIVYPQDKFKSILEAEINDSKTNSVKTYHILDLLMEFNFNILSKEKVCSLLDNNIVNYDIVTLLIEYIEHFNIKVSKEYLYKQLTNDYPETIKIQIINLLDNLYSIDNLDLDLIKKEITTKKNLVFVNDYIDYLKGKHKFIQEGVVILQSMFYGDFEDSGKGNNGGLAILLKSLGNEISLDKRIGTIITITISDSMTKPFIVNYKDNHVFVRLPAYLDQSVNDPFLKRELFIKRYIDKYLNKLGIKPDLFHIRYLDNASMAVAKLATSRNKNLVLTLAPDPHRNMVDETGKLKTFNFTEIQALLNKIKIGDKLIVMSEKVLGIGGRKVNKELLLYFPQFSYFDFEYKINMIAEGIKTDDDMLKKSEDVDVCEVSDLIGIHPSFCDRPIILNVGRLAKLKGQVALFKAWASSRLSDTHNLLIIGGDLENPNEEEQEVINFFNQEVKKHPHLKDKFFHKGAMHNDKVKLVEKSIMKKSFDYPHIYLASSLKEEFGLAILEAMSRGFLILAPIKGGVKSYINHRKNGFLIDTSTYKTIARDAEHIIYDLNISSNEFDKIRNLGKDTIQKKFSIDKIAKTFADTYLSLLGGKEDEL